MGSDVSVQEAAHAAEPTRSKPDALQRLLALWADSLADGTFDKLSLARHEGEPADLVRVLVRQITLRGQACLSFVYRHRTRDITKNVAPAAGIAEVRILLHGSFRHAHLQLQGRTAELAISQRGQSTLKLAATASAPPAPAAVHDRTKHRPLSIERPFLVALGVADDRHQLVPAMARKWKQINKFVEVFASALGSTTLAQASHVRVLDFGSGKGYLTFAVHDHLSARPGLRPHVTGVELRPDMVDLCNGAAQRLSLTGLDFVQGDIQGYEAQAADVVIALHACDTATDHAIHRGIRAGASIILCSPCCHKQIRPQLLSPHPIRAILQHGIHLAQEAEMLTDGLRALLLEACGYQTSVFEFVALEHTNKNKMILAVKRVQPLRRDETLGQIDEVLRFYGIREHCLQTLLRSDGLL